MIGLLHFAWYFLMQGTYIIKWKTEFPNLKIYVSRHHNHQDSSTSSAETKFPNLMLNFMICGTTNILLGEDLKFEGGREVH